MAYRAKKDPKSAIGGQWEKMGSRQIEFFREQGLKSNHSMLDIGCGSLRGGLHFISYLDTGKYTGMDISPELLEKGKSFLKEAGLESKQPKFQLTTNMLFGDFNQKFDYLNAQSVLSHMPVEDIEEMFQNLHKVMHKNSIFIATYKELMKGHAEYHSSVSELNFHYPFEELQGIAEKYGFSAKKIIDDKIERTQAILRITLK